MSCHLFAAALVDESLPRSRELQAHLSWCAECRELSRLHATASRLRLPEPPSLVPVPREAVLGEVRRRQRRRRAVAGTLAASVLCLFVLQVAPRQQIPAPE